MRTFKDLTTYYWTCLIEKIDYLTQRLSNSLFSFGRRQVGVILSEDHVILGQDHVLLSEDHVILSEAKDPATRDSWSRRALLRMTAAMGQASGYREKRALSPFLPFLIKGLSNSLFSFGRRQVGVILSEDHVILSEAKDPSTRDSWSRRALLRKRALSPFREDRYFAIILAVFMAFTLISPQISHAAVYDYYAVSFNNRDTFKIYTTAHGDMGWRKIASKLDTDHGGTNGTWYYNSNTTYGATDETWSACTVNTQDDCIAQAMGVVANQMDRAAFEAVGDDQWEDLGGWHYLERANDINVAVGLKTTSTSTTPVVADITFTYTTGATPIYRSAGPGQTLALASGTGNNLTISGTTATFASGLADWIGIGDAIEYDSNNSGTVDALAFIHRRNSSTSYLVASAAGGTPTATTAADQDWSIYRAYTSLFNAEAGTTNTNISVSFDTWSGGRDLSTSGESWNIALYGFGPNCGTVDYSGQTYSTVLIGTQCWLGENLNVGTRVNASVTMTDNSTIEKYCYADTESNCTSDGGLYQWDEAMDYGTTEEAQGICPDGWHIPDDAEFYTLENYLATGTCSSTRIDYDCAPAATALKEGGSSGFEGLLAGIRETDSSFSNNETYAIFWSSSVSGSSALCRLLTSGFTSVYRNVYDQAYGFSVRCLKD